MATNAAVASGHEIGAIAVRQRGAMTDTVPDAGIDAQLSSSSASVADIAPFPFTRTSSGVEVASDTAAAADFFVLASGSAPLFVPSSLSATDFARSKSRLSPLQRYHRNRTDGDSPMGTLRRELVYVVARFVLLSAVWVLIFLSLLARSYKQEVEFLGNLSELKTIRVSLLPEELRRSTSTIFRDCVKEREEDGGVKVTNEDGSVRVGTLLRPYDNAHHIFQFCLQSASRRGKNNNDLRVRIRVELLDTAGSVMDTVISDEEFALESKS